MMVYDGKVMVSRRSESRENSGLPPSKNVDTLDFSELEEKKEDSFSEKNLLATVYVRNGEGEYTLLTSRGHFKTAWKGFIRERRDGSILIHAKEKNNLEGYFGIQQESYPELKPIQVDNPEAYSEEL